MKNILINFVFAAFLFSAAGTTLSFAASPYEHCRCNQAAPGLPDNTSTCCNDSTNNSYQNNNKDTCCKKVKGAAYSWTGGSANWSVSYCAGSCSGASPEWNVPGTPRYLDGAACACWPGETTASNGTKCCPSGNNTYFAAGVNGSPYERCCPSNYPYYSGNPSEGSCLQCPVGRTMVGGVCKTPCLNNYGSCDLGYTFHPEAYVEDGDSFNGGCCQCTTGRTPSGTCCSDPYQIRQPAGGGRCSPCASSGCCYNTLACEYI